MAVTLADLARRFHGHVRGDGAREIAGVAALDKAGPRQIAYLADKKYRPLLARTAAGAVILRADDADSFAGAALVVDNPQLCFAHVAALLHPPAAAVPGAHLLAAVDARARVAASAWIGAHAVIETGASVGDGAYIGPGCYVGRDAAIGARTRLVARVVVAERCRIGDDCVLHPGAVVGADGFGYAKDGERWVKVPQLGDVVVGNDVEIGANTTIDRGALGDTVIEDGVKLDNLIQIAHNVRIGAHTVVAACTGVAGSAVIGRRCAIGGQVGINGHIQICDDVQIAATSLVMSSITEPGTYSSSIRAQPLDEWRRNSVRINQLDDMARRLRSLEQHVRRLIGEET